MTRCPNPKSAILCRAITQMTDSRRWRSIHLAILLMAIGLSTSLSRAAEQCSMPDRRPVTTGSASTSLTPSDGESLILRSQEFVSNARSFELVQTQVTKTTPLATGQPASSSVSQTNTSILRVVNGDPMVVEMTTRDASGRTLRVIRRGDRVVMKLGSDPWQVASGPYAQLKEHLANPYACPLPRAGSDSPKWQVVGARQEQGEECDLVETVGDSAVRYVTEQVNGGMAAASTDPATRPTIKVKSYQSRHWIGRPNAKRLRVEQTGQMQMTRRQPAGPLIQVNVDTTSTALYQRYGEAKVQIPLEAERLLVIPPGRHDSVALPSVQ